MEAIADHVLEPQIAGPPPRRVQLPPRLMLLLTVAFLLLGLFLLGSGCALWQAGKLIWIGQAGRTVSGQVVAIQTESAPEKGKPPIQVAIRYQVGLPNGEGRVLKRFGWIGLKRGGAAWHSGQTVPVRYAPWFGKIASHPWKPRPTGQIVSLLFSGCLVFLVSLLLLRRLGRWTQERQRLLRTGVATVGTIIHKRTEAEDMVRYFLRYGYASAPSAAWEREEQVSMEQWKKFEVGQPETVLFLPEQPERAGLYALIGAK